jgi:opacity protein-like surface antigen
MRKSATLALLALALSAPAANAHDDARDEDPWYLQLGVGVVGQDDVEDVPFVGGTADLSFDTGISASLIVGRDMGGGDSFGWSIEGEGYYSYAEVDDSDLVVIGTPSQDTGASAYAFLGNVIIDWHVTPDVAWYIGGGAGWAPRVEFDTLDSASYTQDDKDGPCGQFKAGIKYHLGGKVDFQLGYRYFIIPDLDVFDAGSGLTTEVDFETHVFEFGMRWGL